MKNDIYKGVDDVLTYLEIHPSSNNSFFVVCCELKIDIPSTFANQIFNLLDKEWLIDYDKSIQVKGNAILTISSNGTEAIKSGGIGNWLEIKQEKKTSNIHIGNTVHGSVSHSDFSINALNRSNPIPSNTQTKQSAIIGILKSACMWVVSNIWKVVMGLLIAYLIWYFGLNM